MCKCLIAKRESEPTEVKQNKRKLVEQQSVRKRFRKGHRNMGLDESVSASKASMDTVSENLDDIERVLNWSVRYEKDRVSWEKGIWYAYRTLVFYPWRRTSGGQLGRQR